MTDATQQPETVVFAVDLPRSGSLPVTVQKVRYMDGRLALRHSAPDGSRVYFEDDVSEEGEADGGRK